MFEKLLAALPYNPSLVQQLSFYGRRLRREQAVRRAGVVVLLLAFFVQFFAVMSPPQSSLAQSPNDLINGGITSAADAANHCRANTTNYGTILANYGISCDALAAAGTVTLKSTDYNKQLFSMGHNPYGKAGEQPVTIDGAGTLYVRYLWAWDSHAYSSYKALSVVVNGTQYFILYNCGNLTSIGVPKPVVKPVPCPYNAAYVVGDARCVPPPAPCPQDHSITVDNAACKACPQDTSILKSNKLCQPCLNPRYPNVTQTSPACKEVCPLDHSIDKDSADCAPCKYNPGILGSNSECKACDKSATASDLSACINVAKSASNKTQGLEDATTKKAAAKDEIVYTLKATNSSKADYKDYIFRENISDVLDYANIEDLNGGTKSDDNIISWPAVTIKAGETATQTFTVKVMDVIPGTPRSTSDPGHFDLVMSNTYGNTVNIELPSTPPQAVAAVAAEMPHTGPGSSMFVAGIIVMLASFFFARTRLLANETKLAIQEDTNGGL
ncbi:MAG: hypothetical protein JWN38_48 [Candidatus Saccharibacteria bacterium]|nr:hypothetical protein [Candidatus Saccharibacteria bacterium]